jgi:hypothetical protein
MDLQVGDALTIGKATSLFKSLHPRIFCAIPTAWPRDEFRIEVLFKTWARHCDVIKFIVGKPTYEKYKLATHKYANVFLHVNVTRTEDPTKRNIWEKSWRMWQLISHDFAETCDFFIKTDTDAFVMVENLRALVRHYDPEGRHYIGHTMLQRWGTENVKFNIGAGYIISRAVVRVLGEKFDHMRMNVGQTAGKHICVDREGAGEDPTMSICLRDIGVLADNSLDSQGRQRFGPFKVIDHLNTPRVHEDWYWATKPRDMGVKRNCCSAFPVMFHNYKEGKGEFGEVFKLMEFWFHTTPGGMDTYRYSEPPDQGLFRYDPDSINFKVDDRQNSIRDSCTVHTNGKSLCVQKLPVATNTPRVAELRTALVYLNAGAGGETTKPCTDSFCRDRKGVNTRKSSK